MEIKIDYLYCESFFFSCTAINASGSLELSDFRNRVF